MSSISARMIGPGSPFQLIESTGEDEPYRVFKHGPHTLNELYRRFEQSAHRTLIVRGSQQNSYGDILKRAGGVANQLVHRFGVEQGTRVAIALGNRAEWLVAFVAITSIGATAVTIHRDSDPQSLVTMLETAQCAMLITDQNLACELVDSGQKMLIAVLGEPLHVNFVYRDCFQLDDKIDGNEPLIGTCGTKSIDQDQEALITFTSGTTGVPKGIILSHRCVLSGLMNMLLGAALSSTRDKQRNSKTKLSTSKTPPRSILIAPFSYISGYSHFLLMAYVGGTIVVMDAWNAETALRLIARENIRSVAGATPAMIRDLLSVGRADERLKFLTSLGIYGAALDSGLLAELTAVLPNTSLFTGYGMAETSGSISVASGGDLVERPTTVGTVLPSVDLKLVRDDESSTDSGEIWLGGPMIMQGYCGQPEATRKVLKGRWLRTGDFGKLDADGFLYMIDRATDIVLCGGQGIFCSQIEGAVKEKKMVEQVSVFGITDVHGGQQLVVAVVPRRDGDFNVSTFKSCLAEVNAAVEKTCKIMMVDQLPYTPSGKIDRRELKRLASDRMAEGSL